DRHARECARTAAEEFLRTAGVRAGELALLIPPQGSREQALALAEALGVPAERVVLPEENAGDPTTAGLARVVADVRKACRLPAGGTALVVEVAAGLQVACGLYHG